MIARTTTNSTRENDRSLVVALRRMVFPSNLPAKSDLIRQPRNARKQCRPIYHAKRQTPRQTNSFENRGVAPGWPRISDKRLPGMPRYRSPAPTLTGKRSVLVAPFATMGGEAGSRVGWRSLQAGRMREIANPRFRTLRQAIRSTTGNLRLRQVFREMTVQFKRAPARPVDFVDAPADISLDVDSRRGTPVAKSRRWRSDVPGISNRMVGPVSAGWITGLDLW